MEKVFDLKAFNEGADGDVIRGIALCKNIIRKKTQADKPYYTFQLATLEGSAPAKLWGNGTGGTIFEEEYGKGTLQDRIVQFEGVRDTFNSNTEIKINNIVELEAGEYDPREFMKRYYDVAKLQNEMTSLIKANVSETGIDLIKSFFAEENLKERFTEEFAATSHHDNCLNGLLAHTLKVMKWTVNIINMYEGLISYADSNMTMQQRKDLLLIGSLIHDIDKVNEMHYGEYQETSILNHRVRGIIRISKLMNEIIDKYNEDFYNHLIMLVDGHHGMYGDPIETLFALIVNIADNMDAKLTVIEKDLAENVTNSVSGKSIRVSLPNAETFRSAVLRI